MAHDFQVLDSELIFDAPIVAVRRDTLSMPGGNTADREIIEHLGAVAVVALDEDRRIAMVRQYRHSVGQRLWELPAGLLDVKGEDELSGAQRELQEEAGLAAQKWEVLMDMVTSPGFCEEAVRIFLARGLSESSALHDTGDEEADMDFAWVDLDEAVDKALGGEIVNSVACAGILSAYATIIGGKPTRSVDALFDLRPTHMAARRSGPDLKKQ
ncbi:NUDIX domain-containing protein [Corynebacterium macginleyi]|uniref:NUDIX domain-containing protein n=1 Tax=Corynebacterium macginleyi TaxID=38290 RepID=UPI00190AD437|nr:NUDIX hydrolase [Corynebacterium macginleyi]MBK4141477.1 NUDIX domain-containing protein [Corynebacterium macginleyi]MBK4146755.1 NUDIX domain-containing protein [Corynebacterium macginleyi]MBM0261799.1 NUDIX hydrolase [Corynebacterium macginleyi]